MPLHPQAERFLKTWYSLNLPAMETNPVDESRKLLLSGAGLLPGCPEMARCEEHAIPVDGGTIRSRLVVPAGVTDPKPGVCLYFHGGGWVFNNIDTHDDVARRMAAAAGCAFLNVDYRLAPEHPYPTAVEDAWAALKWVADEADALGLDAGRIAVAGDSAGGNLAAAVCLMTRDRQGPPIRQQSLIYPITDCDLTRPSYQENAEGYFLTTSQMHWFWNHYCPEEERRTEPYVSPIRGDLRDLPPALILTAEFDPLRDEGEAYAKALRQAGVAVVQQRYDGLIHAFVRRVETFDAARDAIQQVGQSIGQSFAGR